ncbi:hypothetical protein [Microbispora sp. NPDC046933]|uniref:TolB family protein n=1 Tax=Microbispora sp. NPDC046933 TaxID=3155618 RepID=UPI0033F81C1C
MRDWDERVHRTASLLGGRGPYARRMADKALRAGRGTKDAFFSLYRSYLSRFRFWPDPGWGRELSDLQRAVLVAMHHDGWTEQETAYLCGRSGKAVRRAGEKGLRALGIDGAALADTLRAMTDDLPPPARPAPGRSRLTRVSVIACLVAFALLVAHSCASNVSLGQLADHPSGVALALTEPSPLRGPTQAAVRYAYRVDARGTVLTTGSYWVAVTESDQRLLVEDAAPGDLVISPDGRRLAYLSRSRRGLVVQDLPTGEVGTVSEAEEPDGGLYFSPDGSRLAFASESGLYVWDGTRRRVPGSGRHSTLNGWLASGQALLVEGWEDTRAVDLSGGVVFTVQDRHLDTLSPDGKTWIRLDYERNRFTRFGPRTGRRTMRLPATVNVERVQCWADADTFVVSTYGYGPSHFYRIDIETGEAEPLPALVPEDLHEVRFPGCAG